LIKADLHIHTTFSGDSEICPDTLIARVQQAGMDCIAVADHNTTAGALELQALSPPFKVIISEEILTREGEIIGLFLSGTIPPGLSPEEAIRRIHAQGGLACVPHPFDRFRSSAMQEGTLERIAASIDIVEIANARTFPIQDLSRPLKYAKKYHKPACAGSDSHTLPEVGRAFVEMPDFNMPGDFLQALSQGIIHRYQASAAEQARELTGRLARKIAGRH